MFPRCSLILNRASGIAGAWDPTLSAVMLQCVRWRKMRTDPKAKSKINYRRIPTPIDPWEYDFLLKKNRHYGCIVKAIRKVFQEELAQKSHETAEGVSTEDRAREEREKHIQILEWNELENARTRLMREERLAMEGHLKEEKRLEKMIMMDQARKQRLEELAERVRLEKEASKSYITLDNMQEVIEQVMDSPKDYNFTISKTGKPLLSEDTPWENLRPRDDLETQKDGLQEQTQQQ